jgi:hypothetical protein
VTEFSTKVLSSPAELNGLKGWLPVDAVVVDGKPGFRWMDMHGVTLDEPFFHETVARALQDKTDRGECFTEFDAVNQLEKVLDGVQPTGFIFHSSRCGSTLLANACRVLKDSIVLSEADAIDKLVARFITDMDVGGVRETLYSVLLRGVVNALAQRRTGTERHLFIKFSCCSTFQLARIRRIWPKVPWVFVYRDPVETIVSNLKSLPKWMQDEDHRVLATIAGTTAVEIASMSREELCARAVGSFYSSAVALANENSMLLNYRQLSVPVLMEVLRFFQVEPLPGEIDEITRIASFYSKDASRSQLFSVDSQVKQRQASLLVQQMAEEWAATPYQLLESKQLEVPKQEL